MAEKCDTCGVADSAGKPCALMFQKKTDISFCTRYVCDEKKHAKLAADAGAKPKTDVKADEKQEKNEKGGDK